MTKGVIKMPSIRRMVSAGSDDDGDNTRAVRFMDKHSADALKSLKDKMLASISSFSSLVQAGNRDNDPRKESFSGLIFPPRDEMKPTGGPNNNIDASERSATQVNGASPSRKTTAGSP